jgi:hypothetical protein
VAAPTFAVSLAPPSWTAWIVDSNGVNVSVLGQSVSSLQYLRVVVKATVLGNTAYNPSADVVAFGFQNEATGSASTVPGSFTAGLWETNTIAGQTAYVAKILVGPAGTFVPTALTNYYAWVKISDSIEVPVIFVGELRIT